MKKKTTPPKPFYSFHRLSLADLQRMAVEKWKSARAERLTVTALYDGGLNYSLEVLLQGIQIQGVEQGGSGCLLIERKTRDVEWITRYVGSALALVQVLKRIRGVRVRIQRYTWTYKKAA